MDEDKLPEILNIFDYYIMIIENSRITEQITLDNAQMIFNHSLFIEKTVLRAKDNEKIDEFMSHLKGHWSIKKRTREYSIETLEFACDKLIEVIMKTSKINTDIVEKLLEIYVSECGEVRLNKFLDKLLRQSLATNAMLDCLMDNGLEKSVIEDEGRLFVWHNEASRGNHRPIIASINLMIDDGNVNSVIQSLAQLKTDSPAKKLIIECLNNRINENDAELCLAISKCKRKLLEILVDNEDFRINYIDAIFYFGRNLKIKDFQWISEDGFNFEDVVRCLKDLMLIDEDIRDIVKNRILVAKKMVGGSVWGDVEDECVNEMNGVFE